ncbi:hypothetical protein T4B_9281, partial [Trichinella pseudospiralis]
LARKMDQAVHPQHIQACLDCQSKKVSVIDEGSHSPSDQLPIPGKGTSSGQSTPSHDAAPG